MKNITQKKSLFLLILLLFTSYQIAIAQKDYNIDSLYQVIKAEPDFTKRGELIKEHKPILKKIDIQKYCDWYRELAEDSGYIGYEVNALYEEGLIYLSKGLYANGLVKLKASLEVYNKIPSLPPLEIVVPVYIIKYDLGASYSHSGEKAKALKLAMEGLDDAIVANDTLYKARINMNLGSLFHAIGQDEQAISHIYETIKTYESMLPDVDLEDDILLAKTQLASFYNDKKDYEKSREIFEEIEEGGRLSKDHWTKFQVLLYYGIFCRETEDYEKGISLFEEVLDLTDIMNNGAAKGYALYDLAVLYLKQKNTQKAKPYIIELEKLVDENSFHNLIPLTHEARASYEKQLGNYALSRKSFIKVKDFQEEYNIKNRIPASYKSLADLEKLAGNEDLAYDYLVKYYELKDSITNEKTLINQEVFEVQFKTQEKENQIIALQNQELESQGSIARQRNIIGGSLLGLLFLGILGFVSFRNSRKTKKINNLLEVKNQQNEVLLKEIHHRVKNNLQTISSLLSLQSKSINDPTALDAVQESRNRVASMALIHQKLYQGENLAAIEMRDYFKTIGRAVLKSFGDKAKGVKLEVKMPEIELDVDTAIPIGLITNELITNSLKYAFQEKESGKISISMIKKEDNLVHLQIADDGINQSTGISEGGTGFGTMLIKLLTRQLKGELEQSTAQGTATVVKFPLSTKAA